MTIGITGPPTLTKEPWALPKSSVSIRRPTRVLVYQKLQKTGSTYFTRLFQYFGLFKGIKVEFYPYNRLFRMTKRDKVRVTLLIILLGGMSCPKRRVYCST